MWDIKIAGVSDTSFFQMFQLVDSLTWRIQNEIDDILAVSIMEACYCYYNNQF